MGRAGEFPLGISQCAWPALVLLVVLPPCCPRVLVCVLVSRVRSSGSIRVPEPFPVGFFCFVFFFLVLFYEFPDPGRAAPGCRGSGNGLGMGVLDDIPRDLLCSRMGRRIGMF